LWNLFNSSNLFTGKLDRLSEMSQIVLDHVSKSFVRRSEVLSNMKRGSRHILDDVTLEVERGEIACVLGKNGSGKTTLIRILSTLIEPDSGRAEVCGYDTKTDGARVRENLGVMLNSGDGGFHARLSAPANLEFYAALYKIPTRQARGRVFDLLKSLGLDDRGMDQYQSYSTGMRRRMALTRALLPDAPVLLLDEPTLGVDPWSSESIHNHLINLSNHGRTILCTTNSPSEAIALGGRCFLLDQGRLNPSRTEVLAA
jgi:ABC-2 type transport system ATP-binding protein